jgi:hypothetical protein
MLTFMQLFQKESIQEKNEKKNFQSLLGIPMAVTFPHV